MRTLYANLPAPFVAYALHESHDLGGSLSTGPVSKHPNFHVSSLNFSIIRKAKRHSLISHLTFISLLALATLYTLSVQSQTVPIPKFSISGLFFQYNHDINSPILQNKFCNVTFFPPTTNFPIVSLPTVFLSLF